MPAMKTQVLFIQGASEGAYNADAPLAESLRQSLGPDYDVRYPALPNENDPDYGTWKSRILAELKDLGDGAIVVGHSIGASVFIKLLTEERPAIAGAFLVATPFWHDDDFWHWDEARLPTDAAARIPGSIPVFFYRGDDDTAIPASHLAMYARAFPRATIRRLPGRDHQLNNDLSAVALDIKSTAVS